MFLCLQIEMLPMSEEEDDLEREMTDLTVQLLSLSQDLITAKLRLQSATRSGWILLAKARYVGGGGVREGLKNKTKKCGIFHTRVDPP